MKQIGAVPSTGSPMKHVDFQRGNSKVVSSSALSPRASLFRRRPCATPQKYRNAQQQSRKPSNPISKTTLDSVNAPKLDPPSEFAQAANDDDEWQDLETVPKAVEASPKPKARKVQEIAHSPLRKSHKPSEDPFRGRPQDRTEEETNTTASFAESNTSSMASFLGFSPSSSKARFMEKLGKQSHKLKPSNWTNHWSEVPPFQPHMQDQANEAKGRSRFVSFWLDPSTPGLLALYLQVSFNLAMVAALIYAIIMFYLTIRSDVNMKVEEYSVDIIDQIAKCSFDYLRNGCEPSKRVPAMEAACQQWERCMQRDPKEVGRAKVSAETFGVIIEAFLKPIGIKSMLFLIGVFAGSFLLVNAVFASRIGPRYSGNYQQSSGLFNNAGHAPPQQQPPPPAAPHYASPMAYTRTLPQPSFVYSPSPRLSSPRQRHSVHATLQSSPMHHQPYYPY